MATGRDDTGARIRKARIARGMSQAALGGKVGVTQSAVKAWEHGRAVRDIYLEPLAGALGVSVSDLAPDHQGAGAPSESPREAVLQSALVHILEHNLQAMAEAGITLPEDVAVRLAALVARVWIPGALPVDLMSQAQAAEAVSVSRQAVHRLVAEGRVTGYPNLDRADRAPMVSLAEVRAVMGHHATREAAAPEGDSIADRAPEAIRPLNAHAEDADTTSRGSTLPVDPAGPAPPTTAR